MSNIFRFIALVSAVAISACASKPPDVEFHRATSGVQTIAVLSPAMPEQPTIFALSGATPLGALFGPLGALADNKIQEGRAADYAGALAGHGYSLQTVLTQDITAELQKDGFTVSSVSVAHPGSAFLATYPVASGAHADAYLDVVVINYGYMAGAITAPYHPLLGLQYRLVRASDGVTLMQVTSAIPISEMT
ncbi:MAG TPA: hypothetical protein VKR31_17345 [Rhizomicrobium sp.]|nr:hypothetical protein [Rhizomicrobium sp.]